MKPLLLSLIFLVFGVNAHSQDFFNATPQSFGDSNPSFLPVEQAYQSDLQWNNDNLLLGWQITEGYYLYRERFQLSASVDGKPAAISTRFEPGKVKQDPYFGETEVYYHNTSIAISDIPSQPFTLSITSQGCADAGLCYPPQTQHYRIDPISQLIEKTSAPKKISPLPATADVPTLWLILIFAALGGAILNLMPCVFPVLGLKVLSFANARSGSPASHGIAYSAGVVLSFVAVAGVLVALQQAGQAIGWGFQLQTPWFVALLASLFFVLSLNLLGVFEIGGSWMNIGGDLSRQSGYSGSFFTGVLATVVASPCTAPFMGTAVGFAASQTPAISLLVFGFIGIGMALPVLLLTLFPAGLRRLPKPGQWMITLRQLLAFPLLATAVWLSWVVGRQTGANGMALILSAWLLIGFGLWLYRQGLAAKILAIVAYIGALSLMLIGLNKPIENNANVTGFDSSQIQRLRESGQNVFLDVTADWCITCAANEALVLHTDTIRAAFILHNVHYVTADWTRYDPAITQLLADYQRNGIPLYIYFPADLSASPIVLPQVLSKSMLLRLLEEST
ncbi:thiol:disulfide interchange protein DsbD [Zhongshania antarctica]|uniref:Thiol:disulfide interchange protein DsbD n=1 Tax=Zhongshania antarctica TaxID=641702 RepID=A0A840R8N5_9GAMM|nr:protein-disulfide reductase DsbD [Zhongshania antarctica]MBB5188691.1 thiol:disulfide interchange protein DsbD [Zhongshania antarctica]